MKRHTAVVGMLLCQLFCLNLWADEPEVGGGQNGFEKNIESIVRNKHYYKAGKLELGVNGGLMPYDSVFNQYILGGRLTWHVSDHYAWEIIDYQKDFNSISTFTSSLMSDSTKNITDMEAVRLQQMIGTSLIVSPFYGKIRFFGAQVLYLDIYLVAGLGAVNSNTLKFSYTSSAYTSAITAAKWDFSLNYGLGFKFYWNNSISLFFDLRNYMSYSSIYGRQTFGSNFTTSLGLSIFLPGFG